MAVKVHAELRAFSGSRLSVMANGEKALLIASIRQRAGYRCAPNEKPALFARTRGETRRSFRQQSVTMPVLAAGWVDVNLAPERSGPSPEDGARAIQPATVVIYEGGIGDRSKL